MFPDSAHTPLENGLQICLLGPPQVSWAGQSLAIPRRHVRAVLYYLAAQWKPISREYVCFLLWPDTSELNARRNLTRALTHLRRALPVPSALIADEESLHLDQGLYWCDVSEFRRLAGGSADMVSLQRSSDLYRGAFLAGFNLPDCPEFERWISQERITLENQYLGVLSKLIQVKIDEGDSANAILYARRYLETDELAEEVHRQLISLYARAGDRIRALRQFETCVSILERELGARPLPETRAVYQSVLEGSLPGLQAERVTVVSPPALPPERLESPLVGRAAAIRHLDDGLLRARAGQGRVVLISGEPGIGKSRLLNDFAARCRPHSQVLLGAGQPAEGSVPYHPIVEALRSAPVSPSPSLSPSWLAEVSRVLPDLRSDYPELPAPISLRGEEARIRLFEALCHFIFALQVATSPILLCLDDLHWFDRTSLTWLVHLCRQFPAQSHRVMVVGTYRSEDVNQIQELRDNLSRLGLLDEIKLEGLEEADILELFRDTFADLPGCETFAHRLRGTTGGNPFFIIETMRTLEEEGGLIGNLGELVDFPLPDGVREAVNRRLGRLSPRPRQVLEAGAVLGSRFGFQAVRLTAGRSDLETSLGLDALVNRQLLVEGAEHYSFSHDLVRRATLAATSPMRMRLLHARAGKALERLEPEAVSALAEHFDAGGEWRKALQYHELSARRAEGLYAWRESGFHLERMLELLTLLDPDDKQAAHLAKRGEVLSKLAQLHYIQGQMAERDADLGRLDDLVQASGNPSLELQALLLRVQHLANDNHYQDAITAAEKGLALADRLGDHKARAHLLTQIGLSYHMLGQPVKALAALQEASSEVDESGDIELRALVLGKMAQVYRVLGDSRHALDCMLGAYACHREMGDPYGAARYIDIGFLYSSLGRFEEASRFLEGCLAIARKTGIRSYEAHALLAMGGLCSFQGNPVSAIENCQAALGMLEGLRNQNLSASALAAIGFAYYRLGDLDEGRGWLEAGLEEARAIGHRMRVAQALFQLAMLEVSAGRLPEATNKVQEGLGIARQIQAVELISAGLAVAARIERHAQTPDKARGYAQEALHYAQQYDLAALEVLARVETGLALVELGRYRAAEEQTREAVSLIPKAHQLWVGAEGVHLAHAKVLKLVGEQEAAEQQERMAEAILREKAERIPDPAQRAAFLEKSKQEH